MGGIHLDGYAGKIHLELPGGYNIDGRQDCTGAENLVKAVLEGLHFFLRDAAVGQHAGNVLLGEHQRLRVLILLLFRDEAGNGFMHFLHHFQGALGAKALDQHGLESFCLFSGGHQSFHMEGGIEEFPVRISAVLAEEQDGIHVRGAVLIQRKEKAKRREAGQPLRRAVMENAVFRIIAQGRLCLLDRADGAEQVAEGLVGVIVVDLSVLAAEAHIHGVMHQQNQPVVRRLRVIDGLQIRMFSPDAGDQPLEELVCGFFILQGGIPDAEQILIDFFAFRAFAGQGKGRQILADLAGQHPLEDGHVFFIFLLIQGGDGQLETGNRIADMIHIASADQGRISFVRIQAALDLRQVALIHRGIHPFRCWVPRPRHARADAEAYFTTIFHISVAGRQKNVI